MASWLCNAASSTTKGAKGGGIGAILGMSAEEVSALITAAASKQNAEKVPAAPARSERCAASSSSKSDGSKNSSSSSSARLNVNAASISAQFGI
jgi:hypothetical protein